MRTFLRTPSALRAISASVSYGGVSVGWAIDHNTEDGTNYTPASFGVSYGMGAASKYGASVGFNSSHTLHFDKDANYKGSTHYFGMTAMGVSYGTTLHTNENHELVDVTQDLSGYGYSHSYSYMSGDSTESYNWRDTGRAVKDTVANVTMGAMSQHTEKVDMSGWKIMGIGKSYTLKDLKGDTLTRNQDAINLQQAEVDMLDALDVQSAELEMLNGLDGSPVGGKNEITVTSPYGPRTGKYAGMHSALDIRNGLGDPVYATENSTVLRVAKTTNGTTHIILKGESSQQILGYYHTSNSQNLKSGDSVFMGQMIGKTDMSGRSGAAHLHFTVQSNHLRSSRYDPTSYFKRYAPQVKINKAY